MRITGTTLDAFREITERVSRDAYAGNVTVHPGARQLSPRVVQGRIRVTDSRGPGARRSGSGRRMPAACWHAYRDVMAALFDAQPDLTIRTGVATYRGRDHFRATFEETGNRNIASLARPLCIADACDCEAIEERRGYGWATVGQLRRACDAEDYRWFTPDTMRWHRTRVPDGDEQRLAARHVFRTTDPITFPPAPRGSTVRVAYRYGDTGHLRIETVGSVGGFTLYRARKVMALAAHLIEDRNVPAESVARHPEIMAAIGDAR